MKNIEIYVACHKPTYVPDNKMLIPIQVGSAIAEEHFDGMIHDDNGENISAKNPMYCELTAQYWAWKNAEADYYGFFHYRRYMNFSDTIFSTSDFEDVEMDELSDDSIQALNLWPERMSRVIENYDCIATTYTRLTKLHPVLKTIYRHYNVSDVQRIEDLDIVMDIIDEKYPEYSDVARKYIHSEGGYFCNMFIMKKDIFHKYCEWLFDILGEHEKRANLSSYNREEYRVSGYLGERLFGIFYTYLKGKGYKCRELQRTLFSNTEPRQELTPWFTDGEIPIAFAANDKFAPYLAVTIESLVENSSDENNYDIFILSNDFSEQNKRIFEKCFNDINVHIRFVNPERYFNLDKLYVRAHFSKETYYRLALPEILEKFEKVLYLDVDLIVLEDVAKLYKIDLKDTLIAGIKDADTAGLYNGAEAGRKEYTDNILKLKNPYNYFQAGVLLINLEEFRKTFTTSEIFDKAREHEWRLLDQDVLNVLCEDRVTFLDSSWNVMTDYNNIRIKDFISKAPFEMEREYLNSRKNPRIIHYAGPQKPWVDPDMDYGIEYWDYARKTPYYETILKVMATINSQKNIEKAPVMRIALGHLLKDIKSILKFVRQKYRNQIRLLRIRMSKK